MFGGVVVGVVGEGGVRGVFSHLWQPPLPARTSPCHFPRRFRAHPRHNLLTCRTDPHLDKVSLYLRISRSFHGKFPHIVTCSHVYCIGTCFHVYWYVYCHGVTCTITYIVTCIVTRIGTCSVTCSYRVCPAPDPSSLVSVSEEYSSSSDSSSPSEPDGAYTLSDESSLSPPSSCGNNQTTASTTTKQQPFGLTNASSSEN